MNLEFHPLTEANARRIAAWQYPEPYANYNPTDSFVQAIESSGSHFYSVMDGGELIGFRSFGVDGRVAGGDYDDDYLDTGGGLRPDLTGKGLGREAIRLGLDFGARTFDTLQFRVTIAGFNKRARSVVRNLGFQEASRFVRRGDGMEFVIYTIRLDEKTGIACQ